MVGETCMAPAYEGPQAGSPAIPGRAGSRWLGVCGRGCRGIEELPGAPNASGRAPGQKEPEITPSTTWRDQKAALGGAWPEPRTPNPDRVGTHRVGRRPARALARALAAITHPAGLSGTTEKSAGQMAGAHLQTTYGFVPSLTPG